MGIDTRQTYGSRVGAFVTSPRSPIQKLTLSLPRACSSLVFWVFFDEFGFMLTARFHMLVAKLDFDTRPYSSDC